MKSDVVIIPGLFSFRRYFSIMIDSLSPNFKVFYFSYDYNKSLYDVVNDLKQFIKNNKIKKAHFIMHSYGSFIFRMFYSSKNCKIGKVIQIAPINKGSKVLESCLDKIPLFIKIILGNIVKDFKKQQNKVLNMPLPKNIVVIAGTKRFNLKRIESYIIPLICDNKGSDGKVFIEETKTSNMKEFILINGYHNSLIKNKDVINKIKDFLK